MSEDPLRSPPDDDPQSADAQLDLPPVDPGDPTPFQTIVPRGRMAIPVPMSLQFSADEFVMRPAGTRTRRGELLAERWPDAVAAPLAPADGRIVGMGASRLTARVTTPAILYEADPDGAPPPPAFAPGPESIRQMLRRLENTELAAGIEKIRRHGIWANRWTSPDLISQLFAAIDKPVDTILCNILDESPDLLLHSEVAGAFSIELAAGVLALGTLTGASRLWAVMAAYGDPAVWESLRYAAAGTRLKIVPLRDHYPQAQPSLLIHELTNRHTRPGRLPTEVGVLAIDAITAVAIGRCFLNDEPMLSVPVGLHDKAKDTTHWLNVAVGMPWSQVLSQLSISESSITLRAGNPLREVRMEDDCVVAGGETSVTAGPSEKRPNPDPCIRCGWCVEGCPVHIQPAGLLEAAQQDDPHMADEFGLDACIECGICSYVCPSNLPILEGIRALRASNGRALAKQR